MEFSVETKVSNFIQNQFPSFYKEEGPDFILFVKAYYEWLESTGNALYYSRNLLNFRDIDNTLEQFLDYFQKKYVFGIPPNVIINKRFLVKHILDVYRSKSSIEGYKLLFRILYNEDLEVYLPGIDILRVSDGTWKQPKYLEVSHVNGIEDLVGKTIIGSSSRTTAMVESYVQQPINGSIISILYISQIQPRGGSFNIGEKVFNYDYKDSEDLSTVLAASPKVLGSLGRVSILSGGDNFKIGDVLKIAYKDLANNDNISFGVDGFVKVTDVSRKLGTLSFTIPYGGFGFTTNAHTFIYNFISDISGNGGDFSVSSISNVKEITYNTDCIVDVLDINIDASQYNLVANASANLSSNLNVSLIYENALFGSVAVLSDIKTGQEYTFPPYCFVKSTYDSNTLPGTISYSSTSNTITGTATFFTDYFTVNSVIYIQSNGSLSTTGEYHVIKNVVSNTSIELYGPPSLNSTASSVYKISPEILKSNFHVNESVLDFANVAIDSYSQLDANVYAVPSIGNTAVVAATAFNSGKAYIEGEFVKMYLYSGITTPVVEYGGLDYANSEPLIFSGGDPYQHAQGYVQTNSLGGVISLVIENFGSGYKSAPEITIRTARGSNASISTTIQEYNSSYEVTGEVIKTGVGIQQGYWSTSRGFLNSDKYIQDSYYYQDYSYELRTAATLNKYKNILYNTFHIAGTELFGKYVLNITNDVDIVLLNESNVAIKTITDDNITVDSNTIFTDSNLITADMSYILT